MATVPPPRTSPSTLALGASVTSPDARTRPVHDDPGPKARSPSTARRPAPAPVSTTSPPLNTRPNQQPGHPGPREPPPARSWLASLPSMDRLNHPSLTPAKSAPSPPAPHSGGAGRWPAVGTTGPPNTRVRSGKRSQAGHPRRPARTESESTWPPVATSTVVPSTTARWAPIRDSGSIHHATRTSRIGTLPPVAASPINRWNSLDRRRSRTRHEPLVPKESEASSRAGPPTVDEGTP